MAATAPRKAMRLLCTLLLLLPRAAAECRVVRRDDSSTGCASLGHSAVTVSAHGRTRRSKRSRH